jgi:hypothetical protein
MDNLQWTIYNGQFTMDNLQWTIIEHQHIVHCKLSIVHCFSLLLSIQLQR